MRRYKTKEGQQLIYESYEKLLASWNVAWAEQDIMTTYGTTHVITAGSPADPVLLLLHGTADNSAMMWIYNIEQLSGRFYVIAIDAIGGSGKSEPNERYANEFDQTAWLDELLDAMKIEAACVAGVSYGAYLAYHYAIWRPARVTKIVCMAGRVASSQFEVMSKMMKAFLPEALFPTEASCRRLLRKLSANGAPFDNNPDLMMHWYYLLKHFNNRSMMKHAITIFTDEQLESIREKALFLIGERDILSNYSKAIRKLEQIRLNYKIIKHAGHAINHEQPEEVNREIISYLLA